MHSFILFNVILLIFIQNIKLNYIKSNNNNTIIINNIIKTETPNWPNCLEEFEVITGDQPFYEDLVKKKVRYINYVSDESPNNVIYEMDFIKTTENTYTCETINSYTGVLTNLPSPRLDKSYKSKSLRKYSKIGTGDGKLEISCLPNLNWGDCKEISGEMGLKTPAAGTSDKLYVSDCKTTGYISLTNIADFWTGINTKHDGELTGRTVITKDNLVGRYSRVFNNDKFSTIIFKGDNYCHVNKLGEKYIIIIDNKNPITSITGGSDIHFYSIGEITTQTVYEIKENKPNSICGVSPDSKCSDYRSQLTGELKGEVMNIYFGGLKIGTNNPNVVISLPKSLESLDEKVSWCFEGLKFNSSYSIKIISTLIISLLLLFI